MQEKLQLAMEELANTTVEASAGGGVVTARANGNGELVEIIIDPSVVDAEDVELLQDLVTAAVREVMAKAMVLKREKIMGATPLAQLGIEMPDVF
ncbi:MAG TPA: nucleoid-associated protein, YbaB/EbfC family [Armatimonadetes bacterium]|nr:nucleoid-associated protein, YbaB/EbfC family [Armatimonadota bacterium]